MVTMLVPLIYRKRRQLLCAGLATVGMSRWAHASRAKEADPLFRESFPDIQGNSQSMATFLGRPLVVNFWATWCPPCIHEMPDLQALSEKHGHVTFLGLAVDTAANVRRFVQDKVKVSYSLLVAGHEGIALMRPLGNPKGGLPFTVVFDAQGRVIDRIIGIVKPEVLDARLSGLQT